ncbi:MAG: hypothetical protein Q7U85_08385 [Rhodocyclaceae bacterium]|nr:hypothetical protein [Rhodocyclaceae bacterium]
MARRFLTLLLAFAAMVVGIEGIRRAVDWWNAALPAPTFIDYVLIASLPLIAWLWWRYLSPFRRSCACQTPVSPPAPASGSDSAAPSSRESRDTAPTGR